MFEYKLQGMWANLSESIPLFRSLIQVLSKCYKVTQYVKVEEDRERGVGFPVRDFVAMRR